MTKNSSTLSKIAESEPSRLMMGITRSRSCCSTGLYRLGSRARIQLTLPLRVLISPLWMIKRLGCARSQLGVVLVE